MAGTKLRNFPHIQKDGSVIARLAGLLGGHFTTYSFFDVVPAYMDLKLRKLPEAEMVAALRDPAVRASILGWEPDGPNWALALAGIGLVAACWIWAGRVMRLPQEERVFAR